MATRDEAATGRTDHIAGAVAGRLIRNKDLRAAGLTDVRAWIRTPRGPHVPTNQNEAPPKKRQLNLYLTNDDDTRRTAKAAAMLVDRSAAGREIIEAVVATMEHSVLEPGRKGVERYQQVVIPLRCRDVGGSKWPGMISLGVSIAAVAFAIQAI